MINKLNENLNNEFDIISNDKQNKDEIVEFKSVFSFDLEKEEKIISIIFISEEENICHSIICKNTDIFTKVESLFYNEYPEYLESDNFFLINGVKINRFKSLIDNKIKNSDIINIRQYK